MAATSNRIESIDILRGLVMILMALDHVRDYFYYGAIFGDPTDLNTTTPVLFFTRFITHYCAPIFVFLAGTSSFLYGSRKSKNELFRFLFTRGLWLIFLETVVNNLIWTFDLTYSVQVFQVIWAIGVSMLALSLIIYLPKKIILSIGLLLVAGHNLLDGIVFEGESPFAILWYTLHQEYLSISPDHVWVIGYPVIPWIGVMTLGYLFGSFYTSQTDPLWRKKWLLRLGLGALVLFFTLRGLNVYGDLVPWSVQDTTPKTILSFFNVTKYPPSLLYLCITLGPAFLFLYGIEAIKNKATDFLLVFGRVPLFYYFLHMIVIHSLAVVGIVLQGGKASDMILNTERWNPELWTDFGSSLAVVYLVWIGVVVILYPFCKRYMAYKARHKDYWWLSYL